MNLTCAFHSVFNFSSLFAQIFLPICFGCSIILEWGREQINKLKIAMLINRCYYTLKICLLLQKKLLSWLITMQRRKIKSLKSVGLNHIFEVSQIMYPLWRQQQWELLPGSDVAGTWKTLSKCWFNLTLWILGWDCDGRPLRFSLIRISTWWSHPLT